MCISRTFFLGAFVPALLASLPVAAQPIDRRALVDRHDIHFDRFIPNSPCSLGNGEFAFNFDCTGLQTFNVDKPGSVPLCTMAQWAWHTFPESRKARYEDTLANYDVHGRQVSYATDMTSETAQAIRANPHRFSLARIGLRLLREDKSRATAEDLSEIRQTVFLWSGKAKSEFRFAGQPIVVRTAVHPTQDTLAVSVNSPLLASEQLAVEVSFAYPAGQWGPQVDDWSQPDRHKTALVDEASGIRLERTLDETQYELMIRTNGNVRQEESPHTFLVTSQGGDDLEAVFHFAKHATPQIPLPEFPEVCAASAKHWEKFWSSGGAIDLSASQDPRWFELERRIVLSQFLTASHCAGSMPPQETGLVCNSWFGKSHLEMHWWHAAHFALWGRFQLLERSLGWYEEILPAARQIAKRQGYDGVRWPKMTGPGGISSPSEVGELLIWQQPHPIYYAELAYRSNPRREVLEEYQEIVQQTAAFMADYAFFDEETERYVLGPVLIPAQECYDGRSPPGVLNPTFEVAYWRWGLQTANRWRERLGQKPNPRWADVADRIARPPVRDGIYDAIETPPYLRRRDHPSMLGALGFLPDVGLVNYSVMGKTLQNVKEDWRWEETWGWDFPLMALTAARTGNRDQTVDLLLFDTPKNEYLPNGHCRQSDRLPVYLPANGGLLMATAMMAAGWDGSGQSGTAPGFPGTSSWTVKHEGIQPMP